MSRGKVAPISIAAIIGNPLGHSLSPDIHNAAFSAVNIPWRYVPIEIVESQVVSLVKAFRESNVRGMNVTMPFKSVVIDALDEVDKLATLCGAVNTIEFRDGKAIGHNTDCTGFLRSVREESKLEIQGTKAVLLGAGGVARAVAVALASHGASEITVVGRSPGKIGKFVAGLRAVLPSVEWRSVAAGDPSVQNIAGNADTIINCTPVGMFPNQGVSPLPAEYFLPEHVVIDLIYRPAETKLVREAQKAGASVVTGVGTFLHQATEAFELWTAQDAPVSVMREVLDAKLREA